MKVLVIGSGGREHALCWQLRQCASVSQLYCAPGNPGTAAVAENITIAVDQIDELCAWAKQNAIDLTVVGPEYPLTLGLADRFIAAGLRVFGPTKAGAQIEGSKAFAKEVMVAAGVPTAPYRRCTGRAEAESHLQSVGAPIVIKEDGLAAGKGVFVCMTPGEVDTAVETIFSKNPDAPVVIEGYLSGEEASYIVACNELSVVPLAASHDYKRIGDNSTGPNTGGMGTVSPTPHLSKEEEVWTVERVIRPVLAELKRRGIIYRGFLYAGLMRNERGELNVLEFNARLGDPETQVILRRCDSDLAVALASLAEGKETPVLSWRKVSAICVVLAAAGYPGEVRKGDAITGIDKAEKLFGVEVFHAGTGLKGGSLVTAGGRVLNVTALGETPEAARAKVYQAIELIQFSGQQYRGDIGAPER